MADRLISYMAPGFPASLFELIAERIGAEVTFDTERSGPAPGDDPFIDGRFDLGWICSTSFVDLSLRSATPSVQLAGVAWVPDDPDADGHPVYFSDLVVPADSPVRSLEDLAGRRIGCNDQISLSGHHALRFEITRRGGDPDDFADLVFTGGHEASLDLIAQGALDAAVVDSVVRTRRTREDPSFEALHIVDRLGPWPVQPLVVRSTMGDRQRSKLVDRLLAANDDSEIQREFRKAALSHFVSVGADHYEPVRLAMTSAP